MKKKDKNIKRMPNKLEFIFCIRLTRRVREREYIITIKGQNQVHERKKLFFLQQEAIDNFYMQKWFKVLAVPVD